MLFTTTALIFGISNSCVHQVVDGVLSVVAYTPVTSGPSLEAKLLGRLLGMLEDSSTAKSHQLYISRMVSNITLHESSAVAVVEANILNSVEILLRSRPTDMYWHIFPMLENRVP
ncbi:hypothetical protein C8J57DRAFT_1543419 [Mycena rebaudengoi]|nr:hypothetical protein C8J57DRAFT_1543419 [Mycena rebaudengoi]